MILLTILHNLIGFFKRSSIQRNTWYNNNTVNNSTMIYRETFVNVNSKCRWNFFFKYLIKYFFRITSLSLSRNISSMWHHSCGNWIRLILAHNVYLNEKSVSRIFRYIQMKITYRWRFHYIVERLYVWYNGVAISIKGVFIHILKGKLLSSSIHDDCFKKVKWYLLEKKI